MSLIHDANFRQHSQVVVGQGIIYFHLLGHLGSSKFQMMVKKHDDFLAQTHVQAMNQAVG